MRVNKIFGVKSITNLIYGMLLLLPMVSILSRVIYTQANPNAKDSYSDVLNQQELKMSNYNEFVEGNIYEIIYKPFETTQYSYTPWITYSNISIDWVNYGGYNSLQYNSFRIRTNDNLLQIKDSNDVSTNLFNVWGNTLTSFGFTFESSDAYNNMPLISNNTILYFNYTYNTLDNVFEYSLKSFLDDYDDEGVDFFSWFTNLFLNQSNQHNALYLNFCNWYMNYVLLVSSAYLLFFALMWFINYIRKLLEKSSYHDFGGF